MKAVVKEKPGFGIRILDVQKPFIKDHEVLVEVSFAGICGSDLHIYEWSEGYDWLKLPLILGHEFSGVVVETGSKVRSVKVGMRVTVSPHIYCKRCYYCKNGRPNLCQEGALKIGFTLPGAFAEFVAVPEDSIFPVPENYSLEIAALTEPFCVALYAVEMARDFLGDSALIMGPGPIGLMVLQNLKLIGVSRVFIAGLSSDNERLILAEQLGANEIINVDKEDLLNVVQALTHGIGVDSVFELSGAMEALVEGTKAVKKGGKVFMVGLFQKPTAFLFTPLVRRETTLQGVFNYTPETWKKAISVVSTGKINLDALITHRIAINEIEKGFQLIEQKRAVKVIVTP